MTKTSATIISPSAPMLAEPDTNSGRETDALFGENVDILKTTTEQNQEWAQIILKTDGYKAWIKKHHLGKLPKPTHHVIAPRALMTSAPDIKSPASTTAQYLPLGSLVSAQKADNNMLAITGTQNKTIGYIIESHALPIDKYVEDFVATAESLKGAPYRWGGRDSFGLDCSALVQISLAAAGIHVKRNSGDQEKTIGKSIQHLDDLNRGDLVFWKGHVGIMQDNNNLLHANMWHGMVASENLRSALPRLQKAAGEITRLARPV